MTAMNAVWQAPGHGALDYAYRLPHNATAEQAAALMSARLAEELKAARKTA